MSASKTEVKVTKIEKSPSEYYSPQRTKNSTADTDTKYIDAETPRITEWVKEQPSVNENDIYKTDRTMYAVKATGETLAELMLHFAKQMKKVLAKGCSTLMRMAAENTKKLALSGVASAVVGAILVSVVCGTCSLACRIKLGDKEIGTLPSEQIYYDILSDVKEEILNTAAVDFEPSGELEVSTVIVGKGQFSEPDDVKERLKSTSSDMIPAWGITVDDKTVVALASKQDALSLLEEYKQQFAEEGAFLSFRSRVEVSNQFVPVQILKSKKGALDFLNSGEEPVLLVQATVECEGEETIPFETEQRNDDSEYIGSTKIIQKGTDGRKYVKYYSVRINGQETERTVISEEVLCQPVKQIENVGTKEPPSPIGTGEFARPASGTLTSNYGQRWSRAHCGIDIGASTGTIIYAADNGTVTYSQYNDGGYGYLIKLDHGNGYETYYGHCSVLLRKEGEVVAKGDPIAKVGNTGRSTGPHLHFEVRKNNEPLNPLEYVNY